MIINYNEERCFKLTVTPEIAEEWLSRNICNRPIKPDRVARIANDIINGKWEYNGETIKLSKTGELLDGAHRLTGIVKAGIPVTVTVATGLSRTIHIDDNVPRSIRDQLFMSGEVKKGDALADNHVIATIRFLHRYAHYGFSGTQTHCASTADDVREWYFNHKEACDFLFELQKPHWSSVNTRGAHTLAAALLCYLNGVPGTYITDWYRSVRTGEYEGSKQLSALAYRNALITTRNTQKEKVELFLKAQHSIRAFNNYKLKTLKTDFAFPFEWETR